MLYTTVNLLFFSWNFKGVKTMRTKNSLVTCITLASILFFSLFAPMAFAESIALATMSPTAFFQQSEFMESGILPSSSTIMMVVLAFAVSIAWILRRSSLFIVTQQTCRNLTDRLIVTVKYAFSFFTPATTAYRQLE